MKFYKTDNPHTFIRYFILIVLLVLSKMKLSAEFIYGISSGYAVENYSKYFTAPLGSYIYKKNNDFYFSNMQELFESKQGSNGEEENGSTMISVLSQALPFSQDKTDFFALSNSDKNSYLDFVSSVKFSTLIHSIPFDMNIQYEFSRKFRLGLGLIIEINLLNKFDMTKVSCNQLELEGIATSILSKLDLLKKLDQGGNVDSAINSGALNEFMTLFGNFMQNLTKSQIKTIRSVIEKIEPKSFSQKGNIARVVTELKRIESESEDSSSSELNVYYPKKKVIFSISPYLIFGFKIFETDDLAGLFEFNWSPLIKRFAFASQMVELESTGVPFTMLGIPTLGFSLEQHISEYFRVFYKVSARSMENYEVNIEKFSFPVLYTTSLRFAFDIGVRFTVPEIERCNVDRCAISIKHRHNGVKMRGSNMFVGKDSFGKKMFTKAHN